MQNNKNTEYFNIKASSAKNSGYKLVSPTTHNKRGGMQTMLFLIFFTIHSEITYFNI